MHRPILTAALLALSLAACRGDREDISLATNGSADATAPVLESDVRVVSSDGALVLAVLGDSVVVQLSDSVRTEAREKIARSRDSAGFVGGVVLGAVGGAVEAALGFRMSVPATAVRDLRYEDGELRFDLATKTDVRINSDGQGNGSGGRFSEADARRFIEAVEAAQGRLLGGV
jgi:hypothetical protein